MVVRQWVFGLWEYYRQYTHSAIHAASAAALTIFGLLVFIDPRFAGVAIAAYVCPPIVLYVLNVEIGANEQQEQPSETQPTREVTFESVPKNGTIDTDSDSDDGDTDSDSDGGDTDSDSDDGDTDSDTK